MVGYNFIQYINLNQNFMKTRLFKNVLPAIASIVMIFGVVSCENDSEKMADGKATIQFKLTDAPALDYDEVNIDIIGVSVGVSNGSEPGEGDWIDLNMPVTGIFNLLDYRNGETVLLAGGDIPAGDISQIRLLLGDDNHVVVDGVAHDLQTPSAQTSGLKLNLHETLEEGLAYSFVIDFDAARSVVKRGNGTYGLKPVIRTYAEAFGGSIKGFALPALMDTVGVSHVEIVNNGDTLISLPRETDGYFLFPGLKPALWDLTIVADTNTTFRDAVFNDIQVLDGVVYDLGTVELEFD